ncbi:MAG: D-alanyl-D-alanine carboxypeptidase family protein, partial [Patescibacteria group bacterium]
MIPARPASAIICDDSVRAEFRQEASSLMLGAYCGDAAFCAPDTPCYLTPDNYTKGRAKCTLEPGSTTRYTCQCRDCETFRPAAPVQEKATVQVKPVLSIPIPNLKFSDIMVSQEGEIKTLDIPFLADYISAVYKYAVSVAGVIAAVIMMIGGFQVLTAGGDAGRVTQGKERIENALVGLFLSLGVYLILNTINPDIVTLKGLQVNIVKRREFTQEERFDPGDILASGSAVCKTVEDCRKLCANEKNWPTSNATTVDKDKTVLLADYMKDEAGNLPPGLDVSKAGLRLTKEAAYQLKIAAKAAVAMNSKYGLTVTSAWRPLHDQIKIVCDKFIGQGKDKEDRIGKDVAWPGQSNHGRGISVDIKLSQGNTPKTCSGVPD